MSFFNTSKVVRDVMEYEQKYGGEHKVRMGIIDAVLFNSDLAQHEEERTREQLANYRKKVAKFISMLERRQEKRPPGARPPKGLGFRD